MIPRQTKWYGWKKDLPDFRDTKHAFTPPMAVKLPKFIDLSADEDMPPVYDQGQLGSCTANAIAGAVKFRHPEFPGQPSRLFIYYNERVIEGTVSEDSGAYIRDGMSSIHKLGVCSEDELPYYIDTFADRPEDADYKSALAYKEPLYQRVEQKLYSLRYAIAHRRPPVFGFTVYESFESTTVENTGEVPMPSQSEEVLGGHAVVAVGYDDKSSNFIVRNSWAEDWGLKGYCLMPYDYLLNPDLSSDFWIIK